MRITNHKIMPYILPIITIIVLSIVAITKPSITGFAVQEQNAIEIRISNTTIPINSTVEIVSNNQVHTISIEEFIAKSGTTPNIIYSEIPEINYYGKGYIGNYAVSMAELGLNISTQPTVYIIHDNIIISSNMDLMQADNQEHIGLKP